MMDTPIARAVHPRWLLSLFLTLPCCGASAAPLSGYAVVDLGAGQASLATEPGGRSTVVGSNGNVFDFPVTDHALPLDDARAIIATLPPMTNAPVNNPSTYGNPRYAYSYLDAGRAFLNGPGRLVVTNVYGVSGHSSGAGSGVLTAQRQPDGSFGPLRFVPGLGSDGDRIVARALGLNDLGQVLHVSGYDSLYPRVFYQLSDLNTGRATDLNDLLPSGWKIARAVALDDTGRILLGAEPDGYSGYTGDRSFLLVPTAVPETSALATLVVGLLGPIAWRYRRHSAEVRGPEASPEGLRGSGWMG